jgi:hypothetical protein
MGVIIGFFATLLGALFGASFGSYCSIEYGGAVGSLTGLLIGLVSSHYGWARYRASRARRRQFGMRIVVKAVERKRAA